MSKCPFFSAVPTRTRTTGLLLMGRLLGDRRRRGVPERFSWFFCFCVFLGDF